MSHCLICPVSRNIGLLTRLCFLPDLGITINRLAIRRVTLATWRLLWVKHVSGYIGWIWPSVIGHCIIYLGPIFVISPIASSLVSPVTITIALTIIISPIVISAITISLVEVPTVIIPGVITSVWSRIVAVIWTLSVITSAIWWGIIILTICVQVITVSTSIPVWSIIAVIIVYFTIWGLVILEPSSGFTIF